LITWEQTHTETLEQYYLLLQRALQVNIHFKTSKCVSFPSEIEFLGYCNEAITAMKSPTNVTKLKQFLGLCVYFRNYVLTMSDIYLSLSPTAKER